MHTPNATGTEEEQRVAEFLSTLSPEQCVLFANAFTNSNGIESPPGIFAAPLPTPPTATPPTDTDFFARGAARRSSRI